LKTRTTVVLPVFGQEVAVAAEIHFSGLVRVERELVAHLAATTGLSEPEAARVVEDVVAFLAEPVEDYVRRRHAELRTFGAKNPQIFAQIAEELAGRVVAAPDLTERQLRRIVYG